MPLNMSLPFDDDDYRPGTTECKIVSSGDMDDFTSRLQDLLKRGWKVRGDFIVDDAFHFHWPMYRLKTEHLAPLDPEHTSFWKSYHNMFPDDADLGTEKRKAHDEKFKRFRDEALARNRIIHERIESGIWEGFQADYYVYMHNSRDIREVEELVNLTLDHNSEPTVLYPLIYKPLGNLTFQRDLYFQFMVSYDSGDEFAAFERQYGV